MIQTHIQNVEIVKISQMKGFKKSERGCLLGISDLCFTKGLYIYPHLGQEYEL